MARVQDESATDPIPRPNAMEVLISIVIGLSIWLLLPAERTTIVDRAVDGSAAPEGDRAAGDDSSILLPGADGERP